MRVLFTLIDFRDIGGAQMYFFELAKALQKRGHQCTVISNTNGFMASLAQFSGIRCLPYKELQNISVHDYDIIHASHIPNVKDIIGNHLIESIPLVVTCHSEIIPLEFPVNHHRIGAYIAIRDTIKSLIVKEKISDEKIHIIYNPIDEEKFNINYTTNQEEKQVAFIGSIDSLRKNALIDCYKEFVINKGYTMVVVGRNDYMELPGEMPKAKFVGPQLNTEAYIKMSRFVVGIQNGRTKWEAAMCGKPYFDYQVDHDGNILRKDEKPLFQPDEEIEKYKSSVVAKQIEHLYQKILWNK